MPTEQPDMQNGQEEISKDIYSVANAITVIRLLLVPFFFSALMYRGARSDTLAFILFTLAASSDFIDGQVARRTGTVTAIGKVIDPVVDRLLIASAVIGLYIRDRLPLWIALLLVLRDVYLLTGSGILERHGRRLPVTWLGKVTTAVLMTAFASLIWGRPRADLPLFGNAPLGTPLVYVGAALSVLAALQYTAKARRELLEAREASKGESA